MLNNCYLVLLFIVGVFYTFTTILFIYVVNHSTFLTNKNNVFLNNSNTYINASLILILFSYAGLPPFFLFFFKILVFLKVNTSLWLVITFLLINTVILYYYILFLFRVRLSGRVKHVNHNFNFNKNFFSSFMYLTLFNIMSVLFIDYLFFCLILCLTRGLEPVLSQFGFLENPIKWLG